MNPFPTHSPGGGAVRGAHGFIMITGLLFLVLMTLLAVAMFRSVGLQERIAGNTLDKQRTFEAAQTALQYGEWWLGQGAAGTGSACSGVADGNTVTSMRVCLDALASPMAPPWAARTEYLPPAMAVAAGGGMAGSGDVNYQATPGLYVRFAGMSPDGESQLYQVSAFAMGGQAGTVAVVQSTYQVSSGVKDLGRE
jgi:type IV pilus assembly protein PilX